MVHLFRSMLVRDTQRRLDWLVKQEQYEDGAKTLDYIAHTGRSSPAVRLTNIKLCYQPVSVTSEFAMHIGADETETITYQ